MALQKTILTPQGFTAVDAYITCENVRLIGKDLVEFQIAYGKEKGLPSFNQSNRTAPYDIEGANPFKQAYEFLKTLPEFSDAVDC